MGTTCENKLKKVIDEAVAKIGKREYGISSLAITNLGKISNNVAVIRKVRRAKAKVVSAKSNLGKVKATFIDDLNIGDSKFTDMFNYDSNNVFIRGEFTTTNEEGKVSLDGRLHNLFNMGSTLVDVTSKINQYSFDKAIVDNPAFSLLVDKEGNVNSSIATAIAMGATTGMLDQIAALNKRKTDVELKATVTGEINDQMRGEVEAKLRNGGIGLDLLVDSLGKEIAGLLGVTNKKDTNITEYNKLVTGLGTLGALVLAHKDVGILAPLDGADTNKVIEANLVKGKQTVELKAKNNEIKANAYRKDPTVIYNVEEGYVQRYAVLANEDIKEGLHDFVNSNSKLVDAFANRENKVRAPSFIAPKERRVKVRRQDFAQTSNKQQKVVTKLEQVQYGFNDGMEVLMEVLGDEADTKLPEMLGQKVIGEKVSYDKRKAEESRNTAINKLVGDVTKFHTEWVGNEKAPFYFKWFVARNDRSHLDSNTVNPQTDKELARWLVNEVDSSYKVNKAELDGLLGNQLTMDEIENLSDGVKAFVLGTVQGFVGTDINGKEIADPDKQGFNTLLESFKTLVEADDQTLLDILVDPTKGEHVGHQALAISGIRKYKAAATEFDTDVTYESDGKTNGLGHKFMKLPLGDMSRRLRQVGVLDDTLDTDKYRSLVDLNETEKDFDAYQEIGMEFHNRLHGRTLNPLENEMLKSGVIIQMEKDKIKIVDEVSGSVRNYAKAPAVEAMYGASMNTLVGNKIEEAIQKIMDGIADGSYKVGPMLKKEIEANGYTVESLAEVLQAKTMHSYELRGLVDGLRDSIEGVIEEPLQAAMESYLGSYAELNDVINLSMANMFDLYSKVFDIEAAEYGGIENMSLDDQVEVINKIVKVVPGIRKISSLSDEERIPLIRKGIGAMKDSTGRIEVTTNTTKEYGDATRNRAVNLLMGVMYPTFKEPAASAGPVITHHLDNDDIISTWDKSSEAGGKSFMTVFDAMVLNGNTIGNIKDMNEVFYNNSRSFNYIEELVMSLDSAVKFVEDNYDNSFDILSSAMSKDIRHNRKQVTLAGSLLALDAIADDTTKARKSLYNSKMYIGQMAGIAGSMYEVDGKKAKVKLVDSMKESAKDIRDIISGLVIGDDLKGSDVLNGNTELKGNIQKLHKTGDHEVAYELINQLKDLDFMYNDELKEAALSLYNDATGYRTLTGKRLKLQSDYRKYPVDKKTETTPKEQNAAQKCKE